MNPSLTSLVQDVYTLTNRPDLVGETTLAVRNATLKAHNSDYFYKDIFETGIVFDYAQMQQSLEYKTLIPRWRALKYFRRYDNNTPGVFFAVVTPEDLLNSYSVHKENVCYVAGMELQVRASSDLQYALLGCYLRPDVTTDGFCSWIADEQPAAIIYEAAATVFKAIGADEQNATYRDLAAQEYRQLQTTNIQAVGY